MGNNPQPRRARGVEHVAADLAARFVGTPSDVSTGELRAARSGFLRASAIGSCMAVAMYDPVAGIGGLAHSMLPGMAPQRRSSDRTRYVNDGVRELVEALTDLGARRDRLEACIAGGGNVLERHGETLCDANIASGALTLEQLGIALVARDVGGTQRRSLTIDIDTGRVSITVGDGAPTLLWAFGGREGLKG